MHIIQVVPRFFPAIGGMEEHVYQISRELANRGHDVTVITSNEVDGKIHPQRTEARDGIRVHRFPLFMPTLFREIWFIPEMTKSFCGFDGDVVHAHGYRCLSSVNAIYSARMRNIASILTPHGIYPARSFANRFAKSIFDHVFGRLLLGLSDKLIALSENNKNLLLEIGASEKKIATVPNGINVEEYRQLKQNGKAVRDVDHSDPILLYVGRIDWNKRIERVVESMPMILNSFPSAKLVVVGPDYGNYASHLLDIARSLKVEHAISIAGTVSRERLLGYYSIADIFLLPSSYEGFGLSMLEAMGSKIPVAVSPSGGPGDILTHGENAWFLKETSPSEIFEAVCTLLTNTRLRNTLVNNAFELVRNKYTWKKVVDELEKVYEQAINERDRSISWLRVRPREFQDV